MNSQNITKYQKFIPQTISRSEINNAPYNPRKISDENIKKLKKNIKKNGLIETLVWNKATGNLISGHQRLKILDSLESNSNYSLTIAMVEMDIEEEKKQNIFMNNISTQGEYDLEKLDELLKDIKWEDVGFSEEDMAYFNINFEMINTDTAENGLVNEIENNIEKLNKIKENRRTIKARTQERDSSDNYIAVIFKDTNTKNDFLEKYGFNILGDATYINVENFERIIAKYFHNL
jgi:hypothetical protein